MFDITTAELNSLLEFNKADFEKDFEKKIAAKLNTDLEGGIDDSSEQFLKERRETFGENKLPKKESKSIFKFILEALSDIILIILISCGILSIILKMTLTSDKTYGWVEGFSILLAVLIVVFTTVITDYQKEKQFKKLSSIKDEMDVSVIRMNKIKKISKYDVLVGDLLLLSTGDICVADGILVKGFDIEVNDSALTGESRAIKKQCHEDPIVYSSAQIVSGNGVILVCAVGIHSQAGIIYNLITNTSEEKKKTEDSKNNKTQNQATSFSILQLKLESLAIKIGYIGLAMGILVFIILVIKYLIVTYAKKNSKPIDNTVFLDFFLSAITVLVVAIPEGLPLAVTISLAFSVWKMYKENNLVRYLSACETMGNATTICSDKTGTLTTNRMTVVSSTFANIDTNCTDLSTILMSEELKKIISQTLSINSTAEIEELFDHSLRYIGSSTECALLRFLFNNGIDYKEFKKNSKVLKVNTFSSLKKRMSTIISLDNHNVRILLKGASEVILQLCTRVYDSVTGIIPLTNEMKSHYDEMITSYSKKGLRTLVIAYNDLDRFLFEANQENNDFLEQNLIFLGLLGIQDPVREEVPDAISKCHMAGIVVRMVTGDNIETAKCIALECGIIKENDSSLVMLGSEFRKRVLDVDGNLNMAEFDQIWPNLRVLARSSPTDKYTLVDGLMTSSLNNKKEVVAVTGDGTNDAPALKKANVGFAMGIQGTEIAKNASDIIILDDNFDSIVSAIKWGRNVYDSVSKFLQFQLIVNVVAIIVEIVGSSYLEKPPLAPIQMLWLNLIMDTLASLALATGSSSTSFICFIDEIEPPTDEILKRTPYPINKPIISPNMLKFIIGHSFYQLTVVFIFMFLDYKFLFINTTLNNSEEALRIRLTMIFNVFVLLQLFNEVNARKIHGEINVFKGILANWLFLVIMIFQFAAQAFIVQFGKTVFQVKPLDGAQWGLEITPNTSRIDGKGLWLKSTARIKAIIDVTNALHDDSTNDNKISKRVTSRSYDDCPQSNALHPINTC